jgi:hypothetical protein
MRILALPAFMVFATESLALQGGEEVRILA